MKRKRNLLWMTQGNQYCFRIMKTCRNVSSVPSDIPLGKSPSWFTGNRHQILSLSSGTWHSLRFISKVRRNVTSELTAEIINHFLSKLNIINVCEKRVQQYKLWTYNTFLLCLNFLSLNVFSDLSGCPKDYFWEIYFLIKTKWSILAE